MPFESVSVRMPDGQTFGPTNLTTLQQWAREGRIHGTSVIIDAATGEQRPAWSFPELAAIVAPRPGGGGDDVVSTIIPYKNAPALLAYYLGIFSFICGIGVFLGVAAFILGIVGLKRAKQFPESKGKVHAWIGIICGGLFGLINIVLVIGLIITLIAGSARH